MTIIPAQLTRIGTLQPPINVSQPSTTPSKWRSDTCKKIAAATKQWGLTIIKQDGADMVSSRRVAPNIRRTYLS